MVKWNGPFRSDRSNREKRSTSKGGPVFSKLFRLDLTDPFTFRPKFPEILVEWIAPFVAVFWSIFLVIKAKQDQITYFFRLMYCVNDFLTDFIRRLKSSDR